jgi:hypothetical protein
MGSLRWIGPVVIALAACGGTSVGPSENTDAGNGDARADGPSGDDDAAVADAPSDAAYLACMSASGQLDASLKACQSSTDCVIKQELTDCCGTTLFVGVSTASAAKFDVCEMAWAAHFPACGCDSGQTKTEDGKTTLPGADAGSPQVHCTNFTMSGGVCMTYTP